MKPKYTRKAKLDTRHVKDKRNITPSKQKEVSQLEVKSILKSVSSANIFTNEKIKQQSICKVHPNELIASQPTQRKKVLSSSKPLNNQQKIAQKKIQINQNYQLNRRPRKRLLTYASEKLEKIERTKRMPSTQTHSSTSQQSQPIQLTNQRQNKKRELETLKNINSNLKSEKSRSVQKLIYSEKIYNSQKKRFAEQQHNYERQIRTLQMRLKFNQYEINHLFTHEQFQKKKLMVKGTITELQNQTSILTQLILQNDSKSLINSKFNQNADQINNSTGTTNNETPVDNEIF